jgi:hypothetical protein
MVEHMTFILADLVGITNLLNKIAMVGHSHNAMWIIEIHVMNMWSDNKVCELIVVKVLHTSLLNITVPSNYSSWEAIHRCQCLFHP